jgi:hypothetical protein
MRATVIVSNKWAKRMTATEIANWISAMIECGRAEATGYWTTSKMIRCPCNKPLAIVEA